MKKPEFDYRKMGKDEVYGAKKTIIKQWKRGLTTEEIRQNTGMCINTVRETIRKYKDGGLKALKAQTPGRKKGSGSLLTEEQSRKIQSIIIDRTPEQLRFPFALWTRKAVKELIYREFGIVIAVRTVGDYLKKWGFTSQKPAKVSRRQNSEAVNKWIDEEYPQVKAQAKKENALIFWMDETAVQNCSNLVRGYAPKGRTPTLKVETKKMHINMVSAINNEGKLFFKIYKEAMNTDILKDFCERLIKDLNGRKILLICDNLRVHHAYVFRDWLAERKEKLEVFYLPSYSPEYNPDEYLNNDLKQNVAKQPQAKDVDEIQKYTENFMDGLENDPDHVKSYFDHEKLKSYKEN